jgi:FkbM family methyltransferase
MAPCAADGVAAGSGPAGLTSATAKRGRLATYRVWARSLLSPSERLLPGVGARIGRYPRVAAALLDGLKRLPGTRLRSKAYRQVTIPLVQRMTATLELRVAGGVRMLADTSDLMGRALATGGIWEPYVVAELQRTLRPGDVCVDVGANLGYYTVLASKLVGPAGHVYALEPEAGTYDSLRGNLELNGARNVTALPIAAGAEEGMAPLFGRACDNTGIASLRESVTRWSGFDPRSATSVPVRPLSSVLLRSDLDRISVVKIDVEGYEVEVLRGLEPLLEQGLRPVLIVEVHTVYDADVPAYLIDFCERYDLQARWLVDDDRVDTRFAPVDRAPLSRDLGSPSEMLSIPLDRFVLVLSAQKEPDVPVPSPDARGRRADRAGR